jgi:hypothetical protein
MGTKANRQGNRTPHNRKLISTLASGATAGLGECQTHRESISEHFFQAQDLRHAQSGVLVIPNKRDGKLYVYQDSQPAIA